MKKQLFFILCCTVFAIETSNSDAKLDQLVSYALNYSYYGIEQDIAQLNKQSLHNLLKKIKSLYQQRIQYVQRQSERTKQELARKAREGFIQNDAYNIQRFADMTDLADEEEKNRNLYGVIHYIKNIVMQRGLQDPRQEDDLLEVPEKVKEQQVGKEMIMSSKEEQGYHQLLQEPELPNGVQLSIDVQIREIRAQVAKQQLQARKKLEQEIREKLIAMQEESGPSDTEFMGFVSNSAVRRASDPGSETTVSDPGSGVLSFIYN